jgi:hypothetical protein
MFLYCVAWRDDFRIPIEHSQNGVDAKCNHIEGGSKKSIGFRLKFTQSGIANKEEKENPEKCYIGRAIE